MTGKLTVVVSCLAIALLGCRGDLEQAVDLPDLDEAFFRCRVQPILTKSCAAFACHGDGRRYYRLFARNRLRLQGTEAERNGFMSDSERAANYHGSRAYANPGDPPASLLLAKPLDQGAGGYYHGGAVEFGAGDVFLATDEPDYQTILRWIEGAQEEPTCVEPGSNL